MDELNQVIKSYLEAPDTDYAIMISGAWGCGKTYYINHEFADLVKGIGVPYSAVKGKEGETYSPAFISLYGVSSVEDFEYKVFCGINTWAGSQLGRVASWFGSKLAEFGGISAGKQDLKDLIVICKNRVLVFDDLERICEDKIPLKELLGLINSYAEHSHLKVIVVCNEEHYMSEKADPELKEAYVKYKEKSIRFTYSFISDVGAVYDVIVSTIPDGSYKDYLIKEKESVLSLFRLGGENNIRTLRFFIDTFSKIYEGISFYKSLKQLDQVVRSYLVSYMLYSLEYKRGCLKEDLHSLEFSQYPPPKQEDPYRTDFARRYRNVLPEFRPNPVLFDYIKSGYLNEGDLMMQVIRLNHEFDAQQSNTGWKLYEMLYKMEDLGNGHAVELIDACLCLVRNDKYDLYELLQLFALLLKYDYWHIDGFELTEVIENDFRASMERKKTTHYYDRFFAPQVIILDDYLSQESKEKFSPLRILAKNINQFAKDRQESSQCQLFIEHAEEGDVRALRRYRSEPKNAIPVNGMDWGKVWKLLLSSSNQVACEVCECIISFIPDAVQLHDDEIVRIKDDFLPMIDEYLASGDTRIRRVFITKLWDHLRSKL